MLFHLFQFQTDCLECCEFLKCHKQKTCNPKSDIELWLKETPNPTIKTPFPGLLWSYWFLLFQCDNVTFATIAHWSKNNVNLTKVGFVSALFVIPIVKVSHMLVCCTALQKTDQAFFHLGTREAHIPGLLFPLTSQPAVTGKCSSSLSWELCKHATSCTGAHVPELPSQICFPPTVTSSNG